MRNNISEKFFPPAYYKSPFADWIIHIMSSKFGKIHFLNEFSCTYRIHATGVWNGIKEEKQLLNRLKAFDCVAEILTDKRLKKILARHKKHYMQTLCGYYKDNNEKMNYFYYRLKLLFA